MQFRAIILLTNYYKQFDRWLFYFSFFFNATRTNQPITKQINWYEAIFAVNVFCLGVLVFWNAAAATTDKIKNEGKNSCIACSPSSSSSSFRFLFIIDWLVSFNRHQCFVIKWLWMSPNSQNWRAYWQRQCHRRRHLYALKIQVLLSSSI